MPILGHPMVLEFALSEVRAEAASRTRRHALMLQDGRERQREGPAYAGHPIDRRTGSREREIIERADRRQHLRNRAAMLVVDARGREHHVVEPLRYIGMNQD